MNANRWLLCGTLATWAVGVTGEPVILTAEAWRVDVRQAVAAVNETHPIPTGALRETGISEAAELLVRDIPELDDHQIILRLARLVVRLKDGHSRVTLPRLHEEAGLDDGHSETPPPRDPRLKLDRYPIELRAFDDGYFVVRATADCSRLLGRRLTRISGLRVEAVAERIMPLAHGENPGWRTRIVADRMSLPAVLKHLELTDDGRAGFGFADPEGTPETVVLAPLGARHPEWQEFAPSGEALSGRAPDHSYWFERLPERGALYVQYRESRFDRALPPVEFARRLWKTSQQDPWTRLVLDLRDNRGGNAMWNQPLLDVIVGHPRFDRPGGLYVLIGPDTFSAAMLMVNELEQHSHALFVGAPTGSSPDHYGDARRVRLEQSGVTVRLATIHWKNWLAGEFREAVVPQLPAPRRFADWRVGLDPALELALAHQDGDDPVAQFRHLLENVDVNAAAIYLSRMALDPRYELGLSDALVDLGSTYRASGDLRNSRYTLLLAETYFSHSAEVLYAYGQTLEAMGRDDEAADSYRRALERAPGDAAVRRALERVTD